MFNRACLLILIGVMAHFAVSGQPKDSRRRFVATDVHLANRDQTAIRILPVQNDRYEIRGATMLDLISNAFGRDENTIVGGPNWLEMDRFDVAGKLSGETSPDELRLMLQSLLEERFKLVVREETRPIPGYVLVVGKQHEMKRASGSEKTGCAPRVSATPTPMDVTANQNAASPVRYTLGPGATITYNCRNITMTSFAEGLHGMIGTGLALRPVADRTGLPGAWNFDLSWSQQGILLAGLTPGHVTIFDALNQQLGLKLEEMPVPAHALVVVSVNHTPTPNSPDLVKTFPPDPRLTQFDVISVRAAIPSSRHARRIDAGRITFEGYAIRYLFDIALPHQKLEKMPDWTETDTFNIIATAPQGFTLTRTTDLGPAMLELLRSRFKLAYHTEQRPGIAYTIQSLKPKLRRADPPHRASCHRDTAPSGAAGILTRFTCRNVTIAEFADWFSHNAIGLRSDGITDGLISDDSHLNGRWDFTLVYEPEPYHEPVGSISGPAQVPNASDPSGGFTIFEAMKKQLGLKLVSVSKPHNVIVIDHIERRPAE